MARTSTRNFLTVFRSIGVDDAEGGPDVSQDVQMVYVAGDLRQANYIYGGAGDQVAAVVAEHAMISLECRVAGGIEVMQVTLHLPTSGDGNTVHMFTGTGLPANMNNQNPLVTTLRTTGLQGLPAAPLSLATSGTLPTASIPAEAFNYLNREGFTSPFFINQGQNINAVFAGFNAVVDVGIRWRELRLYP